MIRAATARRPTFHERRPVATLRRMSESEPTIFGRILDGDIPCQRVYENDDVLAFLDVAPVSPGHTLVIPKQRVARVEQLSEDAAAGLGRALPKICAGVLKATGATDYNIVVNMGETAGQVVMHVHVHIIPKYADAGLKLGWGRSELDADESAKLAAAISEAIE
jgi:histidine triad (HIT) family protein